MQNGYVSINECWRWVGQLSPAIHSTFLHHVQNVGVRTVGIRTIPSLEIQTESERQWRLNTLPHKGPKTQTTYAIDILLNHPQQRQWVQSGCLRPVQYFLRCIVYRGLGYLVIHDEFFGR